MFGTSVNTDSVEVGLNATVPVRVNVFEKDTDDVELTLLCPNANVGVDTLLPRVVMVLL